MTGAPGTCDAVCTLELTISTCVSGHGCCAAGCSAALDSDCSYLCGDGALAAGETCDPPSSCPSSCDDGDACTTDTLTGTAAVRNVACGHAAMMTFASDDGCCPTGCHALNDNDCAPVCGNGVVEAGETCDPAAACPSSCDSGDACISETLVGAPATCDAECVFAPVTVCAADGCCADGCDGTTVLLPRHVRRRRRVHGGFAHRQPVGLRCGLHPRSGDRLRLRRRLLPGILRRRRGRRLPGGGAAPAERLRVPSVEHRRLAAGHARAGGAGRVDRPPEPEVPSRLDLGPDAHQRVARQVGVARHPSARSVGSGTNSAPARPGPLTQVTT